MEMIVVEYDDEHCVVVVQFVCVFVVDSRGRVKMLLMRGELNWKPVNDEDHWT